MRALSEHPNDSVPQATQQASKSQSIYRFWSNPRIQARQILASHRPSVVARVNAERVVLAIQDTTDLDFSSLQQTSGLGFICQTQQQGIKVHSCFAVSGDGEPLGVLHQHTWSRAERAGKRQSRRQRPTGEKESQRWLDTLTAAEPGVDDSVCLVHVGDREADIYDLFVQPRRAHSELLIRAAHNRKVEGELGYLIPTLAQAPIQGQLSVEVARNPQRPARQATLTLRAMTLTIAVPRNGKQAPAAQPVQLNAVLAEETQPPADGSQPIRWMLLTTLPVETFEQACQCVRWYSRRWLIERFHFTLKSGCRIEQLQLETAERLCNALATYSIVAWRLMWLTYHARVAPDDACDAILQTAEWRLLRRRFEPKNRSKKPPTIRQAVRWIAQLGGFLARKGDGEPGLKTLWRGLGVLHHLLEGAQLAAKR
ncbi:IS4 family transposase [Romeria aff. gracilis LEGE 07310]|uniref:IS4 family transposase n=1 Tax=Vasconcelosia minhoensis LEGE 07310 TaxID=915328 RepID=A0A8J7DMV9_9CYAN|nr:IS4 family transposase [Romeria aff. gracilis LEGE 07310]